jgi:hypothetical protein
MLIGAVIWSVALFMFAEYGPPLSSGTGRRGALRDADGRVAAVSMTGRHAVARLLSPLDLLALNE